MTNLKKVLSLALVFALALGLMVTASAADWSDAGSIDNQADAVLLNSLNIMSGHANGTFEPDGFLTRAQVAKMVYVARTGGVDDKATLYVGASNTFSDISGHWAEGYINYAYAAGFVAGRGDGTFDPDATMTGFETLKIVLAALGYDAKIEGFVGANWKLNVAAKAQQSQIIAGYVADPNKPITRDDAANIFANLVYGNTVAYNAVTGKAASTGNTFGKDFLGLDEITGVLNANEYVALGANTPAAAGYSTIGATDVAATTAADLIGYNVTALVRKNSANVVTKVYDIVKTVGKNADLTKTATSDPKETTPDYYLNYAASTVGGIAGATSVKYIDNNGNGKYDVVLASTWSYDNVVSTSTSTAGVITVNFTNAGSVTSANYNGLAGLAKDDKVLVLADNANTAKGIVTKLDAVAGTLTAFNATNVYVDNVKYTYSTIANATAATVVIGNINGTGSFYFYNGALLEFVPTVAAAAATKYAYVYAATNASTTDTWTGVTTTTYSVKAILDDGTDKVFTVSKVGGAAVAANPAAGLYTYVVDAKENLELTAVGTIDATGAAAYTKGANKFDSQFVDAKTIAFINIPVGGVDKWAVYTGIGSIPTISAVAAPAVLTKVSDKLVTAGDYIKVMAISTATVPGAAADTATKYLVMEAPITIGVVSGNPVYSIKAFDGTSVKTFTYNSIAADIAVAAGKMYTFTPVDGKLTAPVAYTANTTIAGEGVATYLANNIFGYAASTSATVTATEDYDANTKFYKVNYAAGTVEIVTAADIAVYTGALPAATDNIDYTMGTNAASDPVVVAIYYIAG